MQFVKNLLIYVFGVFTFIVFVRYCFYEDFIPKVILIDVTAVGLFHKIV